ncbi:MAG: hypothetical protein AAGA81_24235 [Acidobacteriota bacterium]
MRAFIVSLSLLTALLTGSPAQAACDPEGEVRFICGLGDPEDLVAVPDTDWVVASGMKDEGRIDLVRGDGTVHRVFPEGASASPDTATFGACPGEVRDRFQPHGVSLRPGPDGRHTLYVVRHGAREAVEVFELDASSNEPSLTWTGCAIAPEGVSLNSVTALPEGRFAATNFNFAQGSVLEWSADDGWSEVAGSPKRGPNGLVSSTDGRWLYVGGWATKSLIRLARGENGAEPKEVPVGFHVDNVRLGTDGAVYAAGHNAETVAGIVGCLNGAGCDGVTNHLARVNVETGDVEEIMNRPSSDSLKLSTVGLRIGDEVWVGGIAGTERIARIPASEP